MRNILAKEGEMIQLGNFFPFGQMNWVETWSGDAQALYVCKLQLELRNQHVCGRRKRRISGNWWAISAIREVLLLLPLNHWANFFALCGNMVPIQPSKMPDQTFLQNFWGLSKWQEKTPKRQQTSIWSSFGALPPMVEGWQIGEPFKSEYFLIYDAFFGIFHPLQCWHEYFMIYGAFFGILSASGLLSCWEVLT